MKTIAKILPVLAVASVLALPATAESQTGLDSPQAYFDYDFLIEKERVPVGAPGSPGDDKDGTYGYLASVLGSSSTNVTVTVNSGGEGDPPTENDRSQNEENEDENEQNENEETEEDQTNTSNPPPGDWEEDENYRTVPEPATILLMAFGTLGLGWASKRRSREAEPDDA